MKTNTNHIAKAFNLTKSEFNEFWREVQKLVQDRSLSKVDVENGINKCLQQGVEQPTPDDVANLIDPEIQARFAARQAKLAAQQAVVAAQQAREEEMRSRAECIAAIIKCINREIENRRHSIFMAEVEKEASKIFAEASKAFEQARESFNQEKQELQQQVAKLLADKKKLNDKLKVAQSRIKLFEEAKRSKHIDAAEQSTFESLSTAQNNTNSAARKSFSLRDVDSDARLTFWDGIYDACVKKVAKDYNFNFKNFQDAVHHGTDPLKKEQLIPYIACYGGHHYHKLRQAFTGANFAGLAGNRVEIIDYGCGQAVATCVLLDYLLENNIHLDITRMTLIEPSQYALEAGIDYVQRILGGMPGIQGFVRTINAYLNDLEDEQMATYPSDTKIHLFSSVLDVSGITMPKLVALITRCSKDRNIFICSSPSGCDSHRLMDFRDIFAKEYVLLNERFTDKTLSENFYGFRSYPPGYRVDNIKRYECQFTVIL